MGHEHNPGGAGAAPLAAPDGTAPAAQEVDVWWGGYDPRALVPSVLVGLFFTSIIIVVAYMLWGEYGVRAALARWLAYYLNGFMWLVHLLYWAYRVAGHAYRLTTARLLVWKGFFGLPPPPVALPDLETATVVQTRLEKYLGVGRIVVRVRGRRRPLVLTGVRQPQRAAELLLRTAAAAPRSSA